MTSKLTSLDISIVVIYFIGVIVIGFWSMWRSNRSTLKGYFLAGQSMIWLPVGASLFASNIGSEHFIGLAGSGAAKGISVGAFELNASFMLHMLGWIFLPVYVNSGANTLPAYMTKRFGGKRIQCYLAVISILLYIFTKISVNLYAASLFMYEAVKINLWLSVFILLFMTGLITITGGLAAVLYTDTFQCLFMVVGSVILAILSFIEVGGISGLYAKYGKATASVDPANYTSIMNNTHLLNCYLPSKRSFQMLRPIDDDDMPWLGFLLGQTPASIWYWCADQMMVQRTLAAKNIVHAKFGTLFAGFIKLFPIFIMVMPGMISRILYPDDVACATIEDCMRKCGYETGCSNLAYPKLVMNLLPQGLRGLMLSVMIAALVSDLTSIFNSASTLFTVDIYKLLRKQAKERELVIVGRLFVIVMIGLSLLWMPVIQNMQGGQLFTYIQSICGYLAPPIAAVYTVAVFWPAGNELGAITSLIYGFIIGVIKMIMDVVWKSVPCELVDNRPIFVRQFHYMYFALFSFTSCIIIMIIVSLVYKRIHSQQIIRNPNTTFWDYLKRDTKCLDINKDNPIMIQLNLNQEYEINDEKLTLKSNNRDPDCDKNKQSSCSKRSLIQLLRRMWNVFIGMDNAVESEKNENDKQIIATQEISAWLYESRPLKILMFFMMLISIGIVISLYLVFSLVHSEIDVGPLKIKTFNVTNL